jgi:hypothetical protein
VQPKYTPGAENAFSGDLEKGDRPVGIRECVNFALGVSRGANIPGRLPSF